MELFCRHVEQKGMDDTIARILAFLETRIPMRLRSAPGDPPAAAQEPIRQMRECLKAMRLEVADVIAEDLAERFERVLAALLGGQPAVPGPHLQRFLEVMRDGTDENVLEWRMREGQKFCEMLSGSAPSEEAPPADDGVWVQALAVRECADWLGVALDDQRPAEEVARCRKRLDEAIRELKRRALRASPRGEDANG